MQSGNTGHSMDHILAAGMGLQQWLQELALSAQPGLPALTVAFSGGLDSRFLVHMALRAGLRVRALHARGPHFSQRESLWAEQWARSVGADFHYIAFNPLEVAGVADNGPERCYYCKQALIAAMKSHLLSAQKRQGQGPEQLPEQRPEQSAEQRPEQRPEQSAEQGSEQLPEQSAEQRPEQRPEQSAEQRPEQRPEQGAEQGHTAGQQLGHFAPQPGLLCDGTNADDLGTHRPGLRALREAGICSPLAQWNLGKAHIRHWAQSTGMAKADQLARPCLLTRFAYGLPPTGDMLRSLAATETALEDLGLQDFRLRLRPEPLLQTTPLPAAWRSRVRDILRQHGFANAEIVEEGEQGAIGGYFDRPSQP